MRRLRALPGVYVLLIVVVGGLAAGLVIPRLDGGGVSALRVVRSAAVARVSPTPDRFVSLVPACGCARHTDLEEFSAVNGRRVASLGSVAIPQDAEVDAPAAQPDGSLILTASTGPRCALRGNFAECPRIAASSCTSQVVRITPGQRESQIAFRVPGRFAINDAVASPDGQQIAFGQAPCTDRNGPTGLFVRDPITHDGRLVFGRDNACDQVGRPAWNPSSTQIAFVYDRAPSAPAGGPVGGVRGCSEPHNELVITGLGSHPAVRRIQDARGCVWAAVAFDPRGILAAEGCRQGSHPDIASQSDDDVFLVQLSNIGLRQRRWALKRGLEEALITPQPGTRRLLITQDLPANNNEPEADWVWQLAGTQLRLIDHYPADDAAQVLAVGW